MINVENVIVGAGPYGLSIAAHFRANNTEALVIGRPIASWRDNMPAGMIFKSRTFLSHLAHPRRRYTLENFSRPIRRPYPPGRRPSPVVQFIDHTPSFRRH